MWSRLPGGAFTAFAALLIGAVAPAAGAPVVTAANISVDDSGATGPGGSFAIGDDVVISWDNSVIGDHNTDVTEPSQVVFDVFGIVSLSAASVTAGVFSLTYVFTQGDGNFSGVSAGVTATSASGSTGPVYGLETFTIATNPPVVTAPNVLIDVSGASGPGGMFYPGDTVVVSWNNSPSGDDNADVTDVFQVAFDLSQIGGSATTVPDSVSAGVFSYSYTFQATDTDFTDASVSVTVTNDAGVTGPVTGLQQISFVSTPVSVPLAPAALVVLALLLVATGLRRLRSRPALRA